MDQEKMLFEQFPEFKEYIDINRMYIYLRKSECIDALGNFENVKKWLKENNLTIDPISARKTEGAITNVGQIAIQD